MLLIGNMYACCFGLFHYFQVFYAIQKLTADAWLPNNSDPVVRKTWTSFAECWGGQVQVETNLQSFICSSLSLLLKVHRLNNLQFLQDQIWNHKRSNPITGLDRPRGFQEVKVPKFQDNRYMKVVKVVSPTHRPPLPPGNIPGTHFC